MLNSVNFIGFMHNLNIESLSRMISHLDKESLRFHHKSTISKITSSIASSYLFRSSVNRAYVSDHVWSDGWFCALSVLPIDHNPWNVSVGWVQGFSSLSHLNFVIDSFSRSRALSNDVPVKVELFGTILSALNPVVGVAFKTNDEGQGLSVKVVFLDGTGFDQVTLALSFAMLAGKCPAGSILDSFSIAIRIKVEIADFPEVLCFNSKIPWWQQLVSMIFQWTVGSRDRGIRSRSQPWPYRRRFWCCQAWMQKWLQTREWPKGLFSS